MRKTCNLTILLIVLLLQTVNCVSNKTKNENTKNMNNKLIIRLSVSFSATIGYGNAYKSKVIEIIQGELQQKEIILTVLAEDKENAELINTHLAPSEMLIEFEEYKKNVPNSMMPITGFVDKDKTLWRVVSVKTI